MNRPTRREAWRAPCASLARHASSHFVTHRLPSTVHVILRMRRAPPIPILFAVACVAARAAGLPMPVLSRLPPGYEVMAARQGPDVDAGRISYLIVLHRPADSASEPSPRPLVIVEQQADGTFRLAARNDEVVLRANEGGQCDPFDPQDADENGLAVKGRFFTVQNFVACGQHWSDYVTFRHDARTGRWLFANEIRTESFPLEGKPDRVRAIRADPRKPVALDAWRRGD
ncbi:lipoprotein [Burkholderia pseudomallei]|nr:lipoprotein [Burkholderia pseudomallei]CAJ3306796.1 lipoprotein [Burkholderia pseudomallei]CAJ3312299.1 lipoprotein [Burkholderia pseudomallei]CAJ3322548.1 lipoprotein [Burkholderia pseudomallei]CAJ3323084.1 lipoprotein [Burkholderia pseudomallei]